MLNSFLLDYIDDLRNLVFSLPSDTLKSTMEKEEESMPSTLTSVFERRASRVDAIATWESRKHAATNLFPTGNSSFFK